MLQVLILTENVNKNFIAPDGVWKCPSDPFGFYFLVETSKNVSFIFMPHLAMYITTTKKKEEKNKCSHIHDIRSWIIGNWWNKSENEIQFDALLLQWIVTDDCCNLLKKTNSGSTWYLNNLFKHHWQLAKVKILFQANAAKFGKTEQDSIMSRMLLVASYFLKKYLLGSFGKEQLQTKIIMMLLANISATKFLIAYQKRKVYIYKIINNI